ncbi:mannitol-1-phosphate 5-dehydrogenase [Halobacillus yeomjeoni]|uniref:mannitol-1-phosphate 5-dehydrogenase n=1 Tax=Halobacillus yeomjeoni TaxID=311194 RepID=UPI001CD38CB7|nr:mannitol-1-phosphate 5-dehydrogenase [Halobacillus yeomjeoni]MCA0984101.1 mannitol-1-phosphate 5-dehydrogenase [Halobacillus yeomjeoni]
MKAVHFGAGNIGRGFIGALLSEADYETTFVDVNEKVINALNTHGEYIVELAGTDATEKVSNVSGLNSLNEEGKVIEAVSKADLITTAVGPQVLPLVAPLIAEGLMKRGRPGNVIACENMIGGSTLLREHVLKEVGAEEKPLLDDHIGFPDAAVDRIVPNQVQNDPLTVKVEPYYEWVVEKGAVKGGIPEIQGITFVDDLTPYIERKLFTVNTGHAVAAYLGKYKGYSTIKEALEDPSIKQKLEGVLSETGKVLIEKYGFDKDQHQKYIQTIIKRFENPDLSDEVTRVGRGPIRKLGAGDRLVKPALEYIDLFGEKPEQLAHVVAAALSYKNEDDPEAVELQKMVDENGHVEAFKQITQLEEGHPFVQAVHQQFENIS